MSPWSTHRLAQRIRPLILFCFMLGLYLLLNQLIFRANPTYAQLETALDRRTPFVPETIFLYVSWFPQLLFIGLRFLTLSPSSAHEAWNRRLFGGAALLFGIANACFVLYPSQVVRPLLPPDTPGFAARLLSWIQAHDHPINCFPSCHVLGAAHFTRCYVGAFYRTAPLRAAFVCLWSLGIILSTVLIRQHVWADVALALLMVALLALWEAWQARHKPTSFR